MTWARKLVTLVLEQVCDRALLQKQLREANSMASECVHSFW